MLIDQASWQGRFIVTVVSVHPGIVIYADLVAGLTGDSSLVSLSVVAPVADHLTTQGDDDARDGEHWIPDDGICAITKRDDLKWISDDIGL